MASSEEIIAYIKGLRNMPRNNALSIEEHRSIHEAMITELRILTQNNPLYSTIVGTDITSYNSIDEVMEQLRINPTNDVYVHVVDVNKYLVFKNIDEFGMFVNNSLPQMNYTTLTRGDFIKYQILTTCQRQRLILTYDAPNEDVAKSICDHAKKYFNVNVSVNYNHMWKLSQLVINIVLETFGENNKPFGEFHNYLEAQERGLGINLGIPRVIKHYKSGIEYITPIISHDPRSLLVNDYTASLPSNIEVVVNITNNIININGNNNNINTNGLIQPINTHANWVKDNQPEHRENTKLYYDRYKADMNKQQREYSTIQEISQHVKKLGYKNIKGSGGKHYWVKK